MRPIPRQQVHILLPAPRASRVLVLGGLKVGRKRLWVWPPGEAAPREVVALCVLDFFVHESVQRTGVGKQLFEVGLIILDGSWAGVLSLLASGPGRLAATSSLTWEEGYWLGI